MEMLDEKNEVEKWVMEPTVELAQNARLAQEIAQHRQAQREIVQRNAQLLALQAAGAAIASSLDLQYVLDTVTREMTNLLAVEGCAIFNWNQMDHSVSVLATYHLNQQDVEAASGPAYASVTLSLIERALSERRAQQITLNQADINPAELTFMQTVKLKTLLLLPMEFQDHLVGLVAIEDGRVERTFTTQEVALAQLLANQAASAIENARLHAEMKRRIQQLSVLHELDRAISASLHLDDVYLAFARHTARLLAYDHVSITLSEGNDMRVTYAVTDKGISTLCNGTPLLNKTSAMGWVMTQGQPLLRHHIATDMRFAEDEQLVAEEIQACMIIPLRLKGRVIGTWNIGSRQMGAYHPDDLELAQSMADQLAIAIENARLYKQTRQELAERRRAEEALRSSEERFRQVISSISDHIYVTQVTETGDHVNLYLSPHSDYLTGYPRDKFMADWHFWGTTLVHPEDKEAATAQATQLDLGRNSEIEYRIIRIDGEIIWVRDSARVEIEAGGSKIIYGVISNITESKHLEEQLRQSQKMEAIGRLAGGVAHDFNNMLTVINGYSELLLHRYLNESTPWRKYIEEIKKAGERASSLTSQLLAFSRKQLLQPQVLDLNAIVADMDTMLRRLIGEDIELVTITRARPGQVKVDRGQLEQVIMNLVLNARDAVPQGGKLVIETTYVAMDAVHTHRQAGLEPGPYVLLSVSDNGCGMDAATLSHIFEPFFTTKAKDKGTGLGLATVYGIVRQSNGDIQVHSQPGQGTTFNIYLPQVEEPVQLTGELAQASQPPGGLETILLVEDEDAVRSLTCQVLIEHGYKVLEASRGSEALLTSEQYAGPIDLVATDVVMPEMSGRELAERLLQPRPEMKVLYMSGYTGDAIGQHGVLDASIAFLQKPFTVDTLIRKVREVLDAV